MKNTPAILVHYVHADQNDTGENLSINSIMLFKNAKIAKKFVEDRHKKSCTWKSWYSYEYIEIKRNSPYENTYDVYNLYEKEMMTSESIAKFLNSKKF